MTVSTILLTVLLAGLLAPSGVVEAAYYAIDVLDPNGGEDINGGSLFDIMVDTSMAGGVIVLTYSIDGGATFPNEITTATNTGDVQTFTWQVPNNVDTTSARVMAEWRNQAMAPYTVYRTDQSDSNFTIQPGAVLEFMNFPDTMTYGRNELIRWNLWDGTGDVGALNLQARYRTGATWGTWTSLTGKFAKIDPDQGGIWFMPDYYETAHGQLKLRAYTSLPGGTYLQDVISDEFEIDSPWIQLISPNGGQALVGGETCTITWATANDLYDVITGAFVEYSINSGSSWINIISSTANDFSHPWTVPSRVNYDHVRVRVGVFFEEFSILATDFSDGDCRIIEDDDVPSVTLIAPNPYVPGSMVFRGGEVTTIQWSSTCPTGQLYDFSIYLSTNNGATYQLLMNAASTATSKSWTVPALDTRTAMIQVEMELMNGGTLTSNSVNPFYIFTETAWNRPPVALADNTLTAQEGALVTLDGSESYDPDGDTLLYFWEQVDDLGFDVEISDPYDDRPNFRANIRDFSVSLVFQLTVSDGHAIEVLHYTDHIKRTSVLISPTGPTITGFSPSGGYEGTGVCISGTNLMGAQVRIGGVLTATVPTTSSPANPHPDEMYNFTLVAGIPPLPAPITVTTSAGTDTSEDDFEVYPYPWYCLENGFTFGNTNKDYLSYPWLVWEDGDYRRTFGNDVYLSLWICIGIPYWTPWDGWDCLGYLIDEPFCPSPLAAIWYGVAYCHLAQGGECFGLGAVNLELYLDQLQPNDIQPGVFAVDDLELTGALRERVDFMHGSQVSAECCHYWVGEHLYNLVPAAYGISGMGLVLSYIENSIDDGELGIISIVDGTKGHILVPYETVDIDSDTTRIYVWDINKPEWSTESAAEAALLGTDANMNHPPYIEIDRDGAYWDWSYYMGSEWWDGSMGLTFISSDVVLGDRTLPTTLDGLFSLVFGCASGSVEDEDGNVMEMLDNGTYRMEIEGGSPFTLHSGLGTGTYAFYLPDGNYTTHIHGNDDGVYNCTMFSGSRAAYAIENAEAENGTEDTFKLFQKDGNPFMGTMTYRTSDDQKDYSATMVKRFGERERAFMVLNASIYDDSVAVINTTDDYGKLVFYNDGPHRFTIDVRFQGNVLSDDAWERLNGSLTDIPTCEAFGIEIGPHERLTIYPSDWLDLEGAEVIVESEGGDGSSGLILPILAVGALIVAVAAIWYWRSSKNRKGRN